VPADIDAAAYTSLVSLMNESFEKFACREQPTASWAKT
jgi:hypothetical protein